MGEGALSIGEESRFSRERQCVRVEQSIEYLGYAFVPVVFDGVIWLLMQAAFEMSVSQLMASEPSMVPQHIHYFPMVATTTNPYKVATATHQGRLS